MDSVDRFVIDFDIWFRKHVLGYDDAKNLQMVLRALSDPDDLERIAYIKSKFPSANC
jgi:hypothetical protein